MTKEEIVKYVMDTPNNTNPAVLGSMIDALPTNGQVVAEPTILYLGESHNSFYDVNDCPPAPDGKTWTTFITGQKVWLDPEEEPLTLEELNQIDFSNVRVAVLQRGTMNPFFKYFRPVQWENTLQEEYVSIIIKLVDMDVYSPIIFIVGLQAGVTSNDGK